MISIAGRRVAVTGTSPLARGLVDGLRALDAQVATIDAAFTSEGEVAAAVADTVLLLDGIDQIVHTWLAPSLVEAHTFTALTEEEWADGCEHSIEAAWWIARRGIAPLRATHGSMVFVVPTIGMAGGAGFSMLAAVAEGVRVLAKGCGRQWGADDVTANTIAAAPHQWLAGEAGDNLTRAISLSTPALGSAGDAAADLAPLVALLGDPESHFLTANTLVADGGTWMGL